MENQRAVKILVWIANISLIVMFIIGVLRINYRFVRIPFIYNISDLLWVYALTIYLMLVPIKNKKLKVLVISIPYMLVVIDEILQKGSHLYFRPNIPIVNLFISGTYDTLDLIAYTVGYILAICTTLIIFKIIKNNI